jgi:hypothetical protein
VVYRKAVSLLGALSLLASTPVAAQAVRAADIAASVGVNVHMEYTDSGYADVGRTLEALKFLGLTLVRDNAPDPHNQGQASYGALAQGGVRFDLFVNGGEISTAVAAIAALERQYPGAVHEIEGPNEINNHATFSYAGITDKHRAATAYQASLYAAVKSEPTLKPISVLAFTDYPATAGPCDIANFHSYPDGRGAPGRRLAQDQDEAQAIAPGRPIVATEFGYYTQPIPGALSPRGQARLILAGLLDNAARGVRETYLYQLFDAYPDPASQDSEKHYGLFDIAYRPKASARMLRRFMGLLQDIAVDARSFPVTPASITINGLPTSARTLAIQKSNGETLILVWDEAPVWDATRDVDLEGRKTELVVKMTGAYRSVRLVDLVEGTEHAIAPGDLHLTLGSSPLAIVLSPG